MWHTQDGVYANTAVSLNSFGAGLVKCDITACSEMLLMIYGYIKKGEGGFLCSHTANTFMFKQHVKVNPA